MVHVVSFVGGGAATPVFETARLKWAVVVPGRVSSGGCGLGWFVILGCVPVWVDPFLDVVGSAECVEVELVHLHQDVLHFGDAGVFLLDSDTECHNART